MKVNGRELSIHFSCRPPRMISHRRHLGLPALWPGYIMAVTSAKQRIKFELESIISTENEELGRRYRHPNYELLVFYKPTVHLPLGARFTPYRSTE